MFGRNDERIDEVSDESVNGDDPTVADGNEEVTHPEDAEDPESPRIEGSEEKPETVEDLEPLDDPAQRLAEELEAMNDRYLRLAAEFENFRKRTRRERAEQSVVAQAELARRLLPTLDDLARVSSIPPETTTVEALDAGLDLILRNLRKELEEAGLKRLDAMGERFDPELHQAMMSVETNERELDDVISRVFVDGYVFGERLVRPAQVEVMNFVSEGGEAD